MVADIILCPHCHEADPVIRHGTNRGGTARCRCKDCDRTFMPKPNPRITTPETEEKILRALEERLSMDAIARMLHLSKTTIYKTLKKTSTTD